MLSESYQSENFVRRFLCSCVDVECRGAFRPLCYTKPLPENGEVNFANSPPLPPPFALYRPCSSPLCLLCLLHSSLSNLSILLLYSSETFLRRQCKRNLAIIALSVDCNMTMFQYWKSFQDFHSNLVDFRVFCISYCSQMYFVFVSNLSGVFFATSQFWSCCDICEGPRRLSHDWSSRKVTPSPLSPRSHLVLEIERKILD